MCVCVFARLIVRVRTCFPHIPVQPPPSPSGANYTGEIVEWLGFAIAAGTLPAAAFALYDLPPPLWFSSGVCSLSATFL